MRFVCDSCRAQYMISDEKVGAKGVKVRCKKCGFVILVRRPQDVAAPVVAAPPPPPPDEGSDETQVMQNPLSSGASSTSHDPETTAPGTTPNPLAGGNLLAGVADDEIGAVFDQVLSSGTHKITEDRAPADNGGGALGDDDDDRMSTRVLDADTVRKLAEEAAHGEGGDKPATNGAHVNGKNGAAAKAEPAKHDWFVAIDEKQVGPCSMEKVKEHWDRGEIGPDSLCWRAGFSDWLPLSEVAELASVLAPQPKKPVIVASPAEPTPGAVVTVPVESAFSAGGVTRTVRSEVPVMTAAPGAGEDVAWKPSAASALASLVKEEIEALAKPQVEAKKAPEPPPVMQEERAPLRGILDVPSTEHPIPSAEALNGRAMDPSPSPRAPASPAPAGVPLGQPAAPYGPTPYATSVYRSPQRTSKALIAVGGVVVALLLVLTGGVVYLLVRDDSKGGQVAQQQALPSTAVAQNTPAAPPVPVAEAPKAEEKKEAAAQPAAADAKAEAKTADDKKDAPKEVARREEKAEPVRRSPPPERVARADPPPRRTEPERREEPKAPEPPADDFDAVFGGGGSATSKPKAEPKDNKSKSVYVPPAPGSANIPEKLGQSDIMQVVLQNKGAIVKCVNEQKQKDPGTTGKLVMRWVIKTNGRTSNVSVRSNEFKSTYVATCIGGLIKSWRFPPHQVQGEPVDFPFTF